jgi:hypothetical protein
MFLKEVLLFHKTANGKKRIREIGPQKGAKPNSKRYRFQKCHNLDNVGMIMGCSMLIQFSMPVVWSRFLPFCTRRKQQRTRRFYRRVRMLIDRRSISLCLNCCSFQRSNGNSLYNKEIMSPKREGGLSQSIISFYPENHSSGKTANIHTVEGKLELLTSLDFTTSSWRKITTGNMGHTTPMQ